MPATTINSICILRLSALGDISHTLPVFHTIRKERPNTKITWIIGKAEYELVKGLENVEFITFDKKSGFNSYRDIRKKLKNRKFDVLLHMQMSLRASLISLLIKAKIKIGFDRKRAKDAQWLFSNKKIKYQPNQHVIDSFFGFTQAIGIAQRHYKWDIPVSNQEVKNLDNIFQARKKYIIISPCSSKAYRNWSVEGYSTIADYINENYNMDIVLSGGNSEIEQHYAKEIMALTHCTPINLIGKTTIKELLHILKNAEFVISPDSGPAHLATAVQTPVIGLYATTNPDRARPYLSAETTVNKYPEAILKKYHKPVSELTWGTRVRDEWAMKMITINDVKCIVDKLINKIN